MRSKYGLACASVSVGGESFREGWFWKCGCFFSPFPYRSRFVSGYPHVLEREEEKERSKIGSVSWHRSMRVIWIRSSYIFPNPYVYIYIPSRDTERGWFIIKIMGYFFFLSFRGFYSIYLSIEPFFFPLVGIGLLVLQIPSRVWNPRENENEMKIDCFKSRSWGWVSVDRSSKATLLLTTPRFIFKSSARDLTRRSSELWSSMLLAEAIRRRVTSVRHAVFLSPGLLT